MFNLGFSDAAEAEVGPTPPVLETPFFGALVVDPITGTGTGAGRSGMVTVGVKVAGIPGIAAPFAGVAGTALLRVGAAGVGKGMAA